MRKMVCFDMDMTLLDHGTKTIPDSALEAVRRLKEKGYLVVIASGRDMDNELSRKWAKLVGPDAVVHSNGQKVTVGDQVLKEVFLEPGLVRRLVDFARKKDFCIGFNICARGCYLNEEIIRDRERRVFREPDREFIPVDNLYTHPLYAMAVFGREPQETVKAAKAVEKEFPELKCPLFSRNEGADVVLKSASKAEGIKVLLKFYGMDFSQVVAFGDSMNDMEMVREAGMGVAMGNAIEELKKTADFVTKPIEEDGILYGLEALGLI